MNAYAVILCGGSGTRMGAAGNKTLLNVGGVPAIVRSIRTFSAVADGIVLVTRAGEENLFAETLSSYGLKAFAIVPGGEDRQASALCGLKALPTGADIALIHDGARPFVTEEIIRRVIDSVKQYGSGVAAVPCRDTIKRADGEGCVLETLDRSTLWQMQTPQCFVYDEILQAFRKLIASGDQTGITDDGMVMEKFGSRKIRLVRGSYENIKITTQDDLVYGEAILRARMRDQAGIFMSVD